MSLTAKEKHGITLGSTSAIFYSINTLLNIIIFGIVFSSSYRSSLSFGTILLYGTLTSFIKDFILTMTIVMWKQKSFFSVLKFYKQKSFWLLTLGIIFGGPIGFTLVTAAILYNGASYGVALSNFSPIIVTLLCYKFLRTKISKIGWASIATVIISITLLSFVQTNSFHFTLRSFIGILIAIAAVLSWALETFFVEYVEKMGDQDFTTPQKLALKSIVSTLFTPTILIPITYIIIAISGQLGQSNEMVKKIFLSWEGWAIFISIGVVVTMGRILYYKAIKNAGATRADILYYLTVILVPICSIIFWAVGIPGFTTPDGANKWYFWVLLFIQLVGIILITYTTKNVHFTFKKYQKIKK